MMSGKMYRFRVPEEHVNPHFVEAFFKTSAGSLSIDRMKTGSSDSGLNLTQARFKRLKIPIAPLPEQCRIVAKLDELFSELDMGVAALERAQAKLKRYRASVLKAAVEGKLTEEWRRNNPPDETGAELLQRILVERRKRWEEEQLAKFNAKGQKPPKNWQQKYKGPVEPNTSKLPELPEGWCWATVDQVSTTVQYGSSAKSSIDLEGVPVLRMGNIQGDTLNLDKLKYLPLDHSEFPKLLLADGDLLFNRTNSAELVGKTASLQRSPRSVFICVLSYQSENDTFVSVRSGGQRPEFCLGAGMDCFSGFTAGWSGECERDEAARFCVSVAPGDGAGRNHSPIW